MLVAELMLAQTQVARVIPRWEAFLSAMPDAQAARNLGTGVIVEAWAGLGYNRRAVQLSAAAAMIVERHGGAVPRDLDDLLALPGVGPYTARAVRVFAFEEVEAVLDTNVARILARAGGRRLKRAEAQQMADDAVDRQNPWAWNQAMLDVGALHCRPSPRCHGCPLFAGCWWANLGSLQADHDDPATGSAAVSRPQSRFAGSDRQGRGRLVAALRAAPVSWDALAEVMGWPDDPERARRVADSVVNDGLATGNLEGLKLPHGSGSDGPSDGPEATVRP